MTRPDILIRRAESGDLAQIVRLLADDPLGRSREDPGEPPAPAYGEAFFAIAADPNQFLAVAERAGDVVATMQLTFIPGLSHKGAWRGQIEAVRVAEPERGTGLGRRMFAWALEACRRRGCSLVQLTSDKSRPDAHRFYAALGMAPTHTGFKMAL